MKNKTSHNHTKLQLVSVHETYNPKEPTTGMTLRELAAALEMIYEIEQLNNEIIELDQKLHDLRFELN